ncbi:amidohydrolase family protein [Muriicola soli]|uniref:Amidohydrolase n=1 Tax=Muriicola soli TaxID=2507538 RepID=A0A411EAA0_9FLAO|nr:amidohydrolase family protein [Muriicola soli]QBA64477.1 amidohydrolase [Muriicola soli]
MKLVILLLLTLLTFGCNQVEKPGVSDTVLFSDVNIVDVSNGTVSEHQYVEIDSGKIRRITSQLPADVTYKTIIEGKGMFLLPGLAEMHAHIPSPPVSKETLEETLFLYLSNGITTIRGMLGHPSHLELKNLVSQGEVLSPRIYTSSPSLNGNTVRTPEEAKSKVEQYKNDGYDFLKIHPGIKRPVFDALVAKAKEVGIPFAGHVPVDVGIRHALQSGYASIDHIDGFLEGLVPESKAINPESNGFFGYNFTPLADSSLIPSLVKEARENKVWIVPTQSLFERWFAPVAADRLLNDPEMIYMPVTTLSNWKIRKEQSTGRGTGFNEEQWKEFHQIRQQLLRALNEGGHGMLLGSDAPQLFNVPGFSIHHEIAGMEAAGMSSLDILQSGTINPSIFFGEEDSFGQVKEGLSADLLLVRTNPLEDIQALKQLSGVMVRGKWLDRKTIDKKLKVIASHVKEQ